MTVKRIMRGLIVIAALCFSAAAGRAQTSLVYVTGGITTLGDARSFQNYLVPYNTRYANGGGGNLGVEIPIKKSKVFGFEATYGYSQNNLRLDELDTNPVTEKSYGLKDNRFSADIVAHSPSTFRGARPYFAFGVEYDRYSPTSSALALARTTGFGKAAAAALGSEGDGGVNFGGGIDYKVTKKVSFRLDVRGHFTSSPTFGLPYGITPSSNAYFPISGDAHLIEYTIGFVYHLGGK